jgi:hypothetical protein
LTHTVTKVIFVRAWFLPSCYECTETMRIKQLFEQLERWVRKNVHHCDPHPDILSHCRQLLSLPIPCHMHWPRFCSRRPVRTADICRKPGFRCRLCVHARACVLGPCLHVGCARAACVGGGSRGNCVGAGGRCLTQLVVCVCLSGAAPSPAPMSGRCVGGHVGGLSALCLPTVRGSVRVDSWAGAASGVSFRAVAPVAISGIRVLLRGWDAEIFLTMRTIRVDRS